MSKPKRQAAWVVGLLAIIIIKQIAYQVWKAELSGFWWPLAQFGALQFLVVYVASHIAVRQLPGKAIDVTSEKQAQSAAGADNKE